MDFALSPEQQQIRAIAEEVRIQSELEQASEHVHP